MIAKEITDITTSKACELLVSEFTESGELHPLEHRLMNLGDAASAVQIETGDTSEVTIRNLLVCVFFIGVEYGRRHPR